MSRKHDFILSMLVAKFNILVERERLAILIITPYFMILRLSFKLSGNLHSNGLFLGLAK